MIPAGVVWLVSTLALWAGAGLALNGIVKALRLFVAGGKDKDYLRRAMTTSLISGGVLLVLGALMPAELGRPGGEGIRIPLVWLMLSLPGWMTLLGAVLVIGRLIQAGIALNATEQVDRLKDAAGWVVLCAIFFAWHSALNEPVEILRGAMFVSPVALLGMLVLAVGAVFAMVSIERAIKSSGFAGRAGAMGALLAGCVIFGFPFIWLILTSFKEERDFSMTEGIMWVPQVQLTQQWNDPEMPYAETKFRDIPVRANLLDKLPNGKVLMEVDRPFNVRGRRFQVSEGEYKIIPRDAPIIEAKVNGKMLQGFVVKELDMGDRVIQVLQPEDMKGQRATVKSGTDKPVRKPGLRWQNYTEVFEFLPMETFFGLRYLGNTMILVVMTTLGTILSCAIVAYGFSRLRFPGRDLMFGVMLATMMLPGAVTMMPSFLIFRSLGWIDTLKPLWVPAFFAGAFNVFLLNQFFKTIPMELEDAAKIDGCSYIQTFWRVMLPQIKPALAAIAIWTIMGQWSNFMGPLIYISSPENMPLAYAVQLFNGERGGSFGLMMAFGTMTALPILILFFLAQRWFIEGVQLSGLGGR